MQDPTTLLRALPVDLLEAPRPGDAWERCALAESDDRSLVAAVAAAITPPKIAASSSFVLHAPLELIARARLLAMAPPPARAAGRRRIAEIAIRYGRAGDEAGPAARSYPGTAEAIDALTAAIPARDAEAADGALLWLLGRAPPSELLEGLADAIIPVLGAAAHAPILLAAFLREPALARAYGALLRAPLRYLTLQGDARLAWQDRAGRAAPGGDLAAALLGPPHVESPSTSINPTMRAVEAGGFAERLLAGPTERLPLRKAEQTLLRLAALSMLQDDPGHAPYGWTHCLTLPQGVLGLAAVAKDQRAAVRVAATHVLGFRATLSRAALDPDRPLPPAPPGTPDEVRGALVARAVAHPDAHLAKYTLACFDAADRDPEAAALYLAAAAFLGDWWDNHPAAWVDD